MVDGCDLKSTPRTRWLESLGIPVAIGHDAKHVEGKDLVIVTPAVARDNPEFTAAEARRKCRGEVLAEIVNAASDSIAVCGSHGKTTTATFIAKLLIGLGEDVEWAIGGETGSFPVAGLRSSTSTSHFNSSPVLVVEADESDGTLALYRAKTLVVTNCEYDHPDHFKSEAEYFACYETARSNADRVVEGSEQGAGITAHLHSDPNARLAVRVALARGHSVEAIAAVLPRVTAELPDRRFQRILPMAKTAASGETGDVSREPEAARRMPLVFADYGHHPTEIRYAIARARNVGPGVLRVLFQPHRYSRTAAFRREFAEALLLADEVVVCPIYAAFEPPLEGGDSCDLYAALRESEAGAGVGAWKVKVFLAKSCEDAWEHARNSMRPGDVTLVQGAGNIIDLVPKIREDLSSAVGLDPSSRPVRRRRIWIGAGTNTVKTDLNLAVEYVKTTGPASRIGVTHPALDVLFPWMAGIPGTLGGWVKMNAGAHGHAIAEVIEAVKVDGRWIPASECGFAYRHSDIVGEIQDVRFSEKPEIRNAERRSVEHFLALRRSFPAHTRGSVFKNPEGDSAGRLLEACGCKGLRVGGAFVWDGHANVIVAPPASASASDFLALMQIMRNRVRLRLGVTLEPEVRF